VQGVSSVVDRGTFFPCHFIRDGTKTVLMDSPELVRWNAPCSAVCRRLVWDEQVANHTQPGISTTLCVQIVLIQVLNQPLLCGGLTR
jgi:hypothetical protein